jgi:hypothetical protein
MNALPLTDDSPHPDLERDIPMHADTVSATHVARPEWTLLENAAGMDDDVSRADILQTLVITTAGCKGKAEVATRVRDALAPAAFRRAGRFRKSGRAYRLTPPATLLPGQPIPRPISTCG